MLLALGFESPLGKGHGTAVAWQKDTVEKQERFKAALEFPLVTHLEAATSVLFPSQETQGMRLLQGCPSLPSAPHLGLSSSTVNSRSQTACHSQTSSSESPCPDSYAPRALLIRLLVVTSSYVFSPGCIVETINVKKLFKDNTIKSSLSVPMKGSAN